MKRGSAWVRYLLPVGTGVVVIALWYLVRELTGLPRFVLPVPHEVLEAFRAETKSLGPAALQTLLGAALGFPAAIVISVVFAFVLSLSPWVRAALFPYLMALQMTPIIIVAPILILWLGPGLPSVATITFLITFFPLVVNTTQGLVSTDANQVELFRMCGATKRQEFVRLRAPAALPYFFTGLRISAVLAPIGAVVGDFFAGNASGGVGGLGFMVVIYSSQLKTPALFATAAVSCSLGFALAGIVWLLDWWFLHRWHDSYARSDT